jgi:hypothetical protein
LGATGIEGSQVTEFDPQPSWPIARRLTDLRSYLGDGAAAMADLKAMEEIAERVSKKALVNLQRRYADEINTKGPISEYKYLDVIYWTYWKYVLFKELGLIDQRPRRILDIGAGACHFALVCQHFGHHVTSLDIDVPVYDEAASALGATRTIHQVKPGELLPTFEHKFDVITAVAINFNSLGSSDGRRQYWTIKDWHFLINDLMKNQLNTPGRIWFELNQEYRDDRLVFNPEVLTLFATYGAKVDRNRGVIDWTIPKRIVAR